MKAIQWKEKYFNNKSIEKMDYNEYCLHFTNLTQAHEYCLHFTNLTQGQLYTIKISLFCH